MVDMIWMYDSPTSRHSYIPEADELRMLQTMMTAMMPRIVTWQ
jgi:hypothetical protein